MHYFTVMSISRSRSSFSVLVPDGQFNVLIHESEWRRDDGMKSDREHLLMALADLSHMLIEALEDSRQVFKVGIKDISLTVSHEVSSGNETATSVEQCTCPPGYKGLSCEDCAPGYTRSSQGFYLGLCKPCECNGHSSSCNPDTGVCLDCRHHTTGDYCQTCAQGYAGDALTGRPDSCQRKPDDLDYGDCGCNPTGSLSQECDSQRRCQCKENVVGTYCDQCKSGSFGLSPTNNQGCTKCWCAGVTDQCSLASMYWSTLRQPFVGSDHGIKIVPRSNPEPEEYYNVIYHGSSFEVSYSFDGAEPEAMYWSLPEQFLGNKIHAFQGNLTTLGRFYGDGAERSDDPDVILIGNGLALHFRSGEVLESDDSVAFTVPLIVSDDWQKVKGGNVEPASREDFLTVLSDLEFLLIKTSRVYNMKEAYLKNAMLDIAVNVNTGFLASGIEECLCPRGYKGTSCVNCDRGFYQDFYDRSNGELGKCKPCDCNGNEKSCSLDQSTRRLVCLCREGFEGSKCENRVAVDPPPIVVTVTEPKIQIVQIGETVTFTCQARVASAQQPLSVTWSKENGQLPASSYQDSARGLLIITGIRTSDSGTYICSASDGYYIYTDKAVLDIEDRPSQPEPSTGVIQINPADADVNAGDEVRIACYCSDSGYTLTWKKVNERLPAQAYQQAGTLVIPGIRESDAGIYECVARSAQGITINGETRITVRARYQPPPSVRLEPERITLIQGREGRLQCLVEGDQSPKIEWSKVGEDLRGNRNIYIQGSTLMLTNVIVSDRGVYVCTAENAGGVSRYL